MITVGIVTPHVIAGADIELADMAGGQVTTRVARIQPLSTLEGGCSTDSQVAGYSSGGSVRASHRWFTIQVGVSKPSRLKRLGFRDSRVCSV
jgi:hypothetical protein